MNKRITIALTDKDESIKLNNFLESLGYSPNIAFDSNLLMEKITGRSSDALIIDLAIIEGSELNLPKFIGERNPGMAVIIVGAKEHLERSIAIASKRGFRYVVSPINHSEIRYLLEDFFRGRESSAVLQEPEDYFSSVFIGKSESVQKTASKIRKISKSDSNILITGETGTGKELVARSIYEMSGRSGEGFIAVNSSAIPENLLESELFGYKKGAFTGAGADKKGLIELADNGTLFLDEIGDLSPALQAKLLRIIEYKELRRLGDETVKKVNVRVLAATNKDLAKMMSEGAFREDLFFRINVIHIHIPPLRERKEDIPLIFRYLVEKYNKQYRKNIIGIAPNARAVIMNYDYPGNVRELDNAVQHAFAMAEDDTIRLEDLPVYMHGTTSFRTLEAHFGEGGEGNGAGELLLSEVEKKTIIKALDKFGSNHTKAAAALGVSRSTLWRKMKEYSIKTAGNN